MKDISNIETNKQMEKAISVIIPIYKAEKVLNRCLDSILHQTFTDIELILVDDGSPDRSGDICEEYARKDKRVRVFHKENGGVASARQVGIDVAQGEYVIHADPDDYVEPTMLERLYKCAKDNVADVVICDFYVNQSNSEYVVTQKPSSTDHLMVLAELFQHLHGSCWNKLIRQTCYRQYNITFPKNVSYCEDLSFWVSVFQHPVKISYLPEAFYHYVQHNESIVHCYMNKKEDDGWKLMCFLSKELKKYPKIKKEALAHTAYTVVNGAYTFGDFNSFSFSMRYLRYVPYFMQYKKTSLSKRLFFAIVCLGLYSHYKYRQK